jgi:methyl-accepting chemotaxis protein
MAKLREIVMITFFNDLKVGVKIGLGFVLVGAIILVSISLTMVQTGKSADITRRVVDLRVPTAQASLMMVNGMNHSLAALRGWMLLGKDKFKAERAKAWSQEIDPSLKQMKDFSVNWTDPGNIERLKVIEKKLADFRKYQTEIETISNTIDNLPASKILFQDAAPQAAILVGNITKIINIEARLEATPERKALLGMMADVRGTTARGLANIRAYLLSGDQKFKDRFDTMWTKNIKRFGDLTNNQALLSPKQSTLFREFSQARTVFAPMPPRMFEIRGGEEWNLANSWLGTKAAPTAFAIKEQLDGMIVSQKNLLAADMTETKNLAASLSNMLWILLFAGMALCAVLGFFITRSITKPLEKVAMATQDLAGGSLNQQGIEIDSRDELGMLGSNMNQLQTTIKNFIQGTEQILKGNVDWDISEFKGDFQHSIKGILTQARDKAVADAETSRISQIVENMATNIMYADVDLKLQYMNPASLKTFKKLQHVLPVKADEMIGQSIDAFHKNPQHQRNLLSDPKNLPHQAQIQLGEEILNLNSAAIMDVDGNHIGTMVGWDIITKAVKNEQSAREAAEREHIQAEELKAKVDSMLDVVSSAAEGDLSRDVTVKGSDAIGRMGEGLSAFLQKMRTSIQAIGENASTLASSSEELTAVSQQMAGNAEETSAQSGVVSAASEEVSKNVQTVSTGAEEMSASIKEIAQNASEASRVASEAVQVANTTNATISKLGESSAEIGQVIKVITSIAEQTNLLALNATIEAARAGEAGKGFAVVANEVKDLANQTAKATEEISGKIGAIQSDTESSVSAIAEISEVINKINDISNTIASAVEEQTATTAEIGRNVGEAAKGTAEIAQNITGFAEAAQSTTQGATDTQAASTELSKMAAELQGLVGQFKV